MCVDAKNQVSTPLRAQCPVRSCDGIIGHAWKARTSRQTPGGGGHFWGCSASHEVLVVLGESSSDGRSSFRKWKGEKVPRA